MYLGQELIREQFCPRLSLGIETLIRLSYQTTRGRSLSAMSIHGIINDYEMNALISVIPNGINLRLSRNGIVFIYYW